MLLMNFLKRSCDRSQMQVLVSLMIVFPAELQLVSCHLDPQFLNISQEMIARKNVSEMTHFVLSRTYNNLSWISADPER